MNGNIFDQLRKNANDKELQVRVAATVASAAATYMVEKIEAASNGAVPGFIKLMEPYWQDFQFYAGLHDDLDRRCKERQKMNPHTTTVNTDLSNVEMFGAVAATLDVPNSKVRTSSLVPVHEKPNASVSEKLRTALDLLELAAAFVPDSNAVGHMIGPIVSLVLGELERRKQVDKRDAFSDTSRFLNQLEDINKYLEKIAVGVHCVPDFWPRLNNVPMQRQMRGLPGAKHLPSTQPLTVEEAQLSVSNALEQQRRLKLTSPGRLI